MQLQINSHAFNIRNNRTSRNITVVLFPLPILIEIAVSFCCLRILQVQVIADEAIHNVCETVAINALQKQVPQPICRNWNIQRDNPYFQARRLALYEEFYLSLFRKIVCDMRKFVADHRTFEVISGVSGRMR